MPQLRWLRRPQSSALGEALPLFPLGCPRSGTTLLARLLNAHPAVLMTNETAVFLMLHENIVKSRLGVQAGLLYGKEHHVLWSEHLAQHAQRLIEEYYEKISRAEGKRGLRYWGEKHPHHSRCLDFITALYPNARYVYIVRDPRDTACSIAEMRQTDFRKGLQTWKNFADAYEAFTGELGGDRLYRLRYEDLVTDYTGEARKMFDWLGLDLARPVERFLAKHQNHDMHSALSARAAPVDFGLESVGRWRREVEEADRQYAEALAGDFIERHGYRRDGERPQTGGSRGH